MGDSFRVLGPSQSMSGAVDVETADGRVVPVAADHPDVQAAMMSAPQAPPSPEPAMSPAPDGWNPPPAAPAPSAGGLPAPQNTWHEPKRMERLPMPPRPVEDGVTYQASTPQPPPAAPAQMDPRARVLENARIVNDMYAPKGGGGPVKRTTQTTEAKAKLYSDADRQRLGELGGQKEEAENQSLDAAVQATSAVQDAATERARLADTQAKEAENEMARLAERRKLQETRLADFEQRRVAAENDAKSAEGQMLGKETSARIIAALGMVFAGAGDAMTGGTGHALANVQGQLNAELDRQKRELAEKRAKPGQYVNAYQQLLAQMGDEAAASKAFLSAGNAVVEAKLNRITQGMQSTQAQAQKQALVAGLQDQRAAAGIQAINAAAPEVTTVSTVKTGSGGGARKFAVGADTVFKALEDASSPEEAAKLLNLGGWQMTQSLDAGQLKSARDEVMAYKAADSLMGQLQALREKYKGAKKLSPEMRSKVQTVAKMLQQAIAKQGGGVITDQDRAYAGELMGNPDAILEVTADTRLGTLRDVSRQVFQDSITAYGIVPAQGTPAANDQLMASVGATPRGAQ